MLTYSLDSLESGLPVVRIPISSVESVTVLILANTGSRYEKEGQHGIAHFFEHLVFKGTDKFPDALTLAATVDSIGASFNAFTSKEYTGYYMKAASKHFDLAVDVISDMMLAPKLKQEDIDREKGVIIEELNMYVDTPNHHIANLFDQMVYRGSGLEHDIIGNKESINNLSATDFRDLLAKWYGLDNMVLVLAGDEKILKNGKKLQLVEEMFSKGSNFVGRRSGFVGRRLRVADRPTGVYPAKRGELFVVDSLNSVANKIDTLVSNKVKIDGFLTKNPISNEKLHVEYRETEQAHFVLGWPGLKRKSKKRYALSLLSIILGGNMSSRLFSEVREKRGLCYYVHSELDQFHDGGIFGASAGVDPNRVDEALRVTLDQFKAVASGDSGIDDKELQKAKDYLTGKMVLNFEDSGAVAQYYGLKLLLMEKIESPQSAMKKINAVTRKEVENLAKELIKPGELRLAIIGSFKDKERFNGLGISR